MYLCVGQNNQAGKSLLKTDFVQDASLETNFKLAIKILLKTMDSTAPGADRIELSSLRQDTDGSIVHEFVPTDKVNINTISNIFRMFYARGLKYDSSIIF